MTALDMRMHIYDQLDQGQWESVVTELEAILADDASETLHAGRNTIKKAVIHGQPVIIKHFKNDGMRKKLAYKLRSSKAKRSYEHSQKLIDAGLLAPTPLLWREDWKGAWLHQSFFVSAYHEVAFTAWDLKKDNLPNNEQWVIHLGQQIGKMHNAGLHHQDLTPGNILFVSEGDSFLMYFIDCNRMSFGAIGKDQGMRALVRMGLEGQHIDPYARAYAEERDLDVEWCQNRYRQLLKRHQFKWRLKNKTRPWRRKLGL